MLESLDLENPGRLGIQMVVTLVGQLSGKLELKRKGWKEFNIRFTDPFARFSTGEGLIYFR